MSKIIQIIPFVDERFDIDIVAVGLKENGEVVFLESSEEGIREFEGDPKLIAKYKNNNTHWYLIYADNPEEAAERLQDFESRSDVTVLKITPVARDIDFSFLIEYKD